MASGNSLVTIGVVAVGGYLAYKWLFATPAASVASSGSTSTDTGTSTSSTTSTTPAFNSLDAIYARLAAAAGSGTHTVDEFNFFLGQQLPSGKTPPDPLAVFTTAGFDRNAQMTLANYWGVMAPYLKANLGLSGCGLFGGLGALAIGARRRR